MLMIPSRMMPSRLQDPAVLLKTNPSTGRRCFSTQAHEERIQQEKEYRKAKLDQRNRRRQHHSQDFPQEVEKATQELRIQESFFTKLAREENYAKGFGEGSSDRGKTNIVSNVRKAKHETAEALQYVYPNTSPDDLASAHHRHTNLAALNSEPKSGP